MVLPIREVLEFIVDNMKKYKAPLSVSPEKCSGWARGLDVPRGGETVLYTSCLYQLIPYINALTRQLEDMESRRGTGLALRLARVVGKLIDLSKIVARVSQEEVERSYKVVRSIALLLKKAGVNYGYLYEDDVYSGALLYDLGIDDVFANHARWVYGLFKKHGVKKVITIDPHSLHILREVYPKYVDNYDLEVISYLEILEKTGIRPVTKLDTEVTIHDPCLYGRYENVVEPQRKLLAEAGVKIVEPARTKNMTYCCGGPIESITPRLAHKIAETRLKELMESSKNIITLCPICYANLVRAAPKTARVEDVALYLAKAYGAES